MKYLLIATSLMFGVNCWGQEHVVTMKSPEQNVLYRGYTNKVVPEVTNRDGRAISLSARNASVSYKPNESGFIVKPGSGKTADLTVSLINENGKVEVLKTFKYEISNLPVPLVYWGDLESGEIGNITAKKLSIKYPEGIPLKNEFSITSWEISTNNETITGNGNDISSAEDFLKKIKSGTTLLFKVKVLSPDGITRLKSAQWEVQSWSDEVKMNPLGFDRE